VELLDEAVELRQRQVAAHVVRCLLQMPPSLFSPLLSFLFSLSYSPRARCLGSPCVGGCDDGARTRRPPSPPAAHQCADRRREVASTDTVKELDS
jgi:hypothetical protein